MIRVGMVICLFFWASLMLAAHPQYMQSFVVGLAVVGPIIFVTIYLRTLGLFVTELRRFMRIRLFVWHAKKDKN
jgi:hypothetical protein